MSFPRCWLRGFPGCRHPGEVWAGAFGPDGRTVLTGSKDGTARLWEAPAVPAGGSARFRLWAEVLTGMELDAEWQGRRKGRNIQ